MIWLQIKIWCHEEFKTNMFEAHFPSSISVDNEKLLNPSEMTFSNSVLVFVWYSAHSFGTLLHLGLNKPLSPSLVEGVLVQTGISAPARTVDLICLRWAWTQTSRLSCNKRFINIPDGAARSGRASVAHLPWCWENWWETGERGLLTQGTGFTSGSSQWWGGPSGTLPAFSQRL